MGVPDVHRDSTEASSKGPRSVEEAERYRLSFESTAPGRLIKAVDNLYAFVPNPVPRTLDLDSARVNQLALTERALGELRGIGRTLQNPRLLISPFLRKEAVLSSKIEGTTASLKDVVIFGVWATPYRNRTSGQTSYL